MLTCFMYSHTLASAAAGTVATCFIPEIELILYVEYNFGTTYTSP